MEGSGTLDPKRKGYASTRQKKGMLKGGRPKQAGKAAEASGDRTTCVLKTKRLRVVKEPPQGKTLKRGEGGLRYMPVINSKRKKTFCKGAPLRGRRSEPFSRGGARRDPRPRWANCLAGEYRP